MDLRRAVAENLDFGLSGCERARSRGRKSRRASRDRKQVADESYWPTGQISRARC